MKRAPWNPKRVLSLAAVATACALFGGAGCKSEVEKADEKVNAAVAQGESPALSPKEVADAAEKAVAVKNASLTAQVTANTQLAAAQTAQADELMSDIDRGENRIAELVAEISRAVDTIKSNNTLQLAYKKSEPVGARQAVEKAKDAALGKTDPVWFKHESGPVPAMSGVDKTIADLQKQIQVVEGEIKRLGDERTKAIAEAERLGKESEAAEGRKSLDLFTKSEAQRDVSRQDAAKIVQQQSKLKELNEDLDRVQAEKKLLTTAVASLDAQLKATDAGWTQTETDIKQLKDLTLALLGNGASGAPAGGASENGGGGSGADNGGAKESTPATPDTEKPAPPAEEKKEDDTAKPAARVPVNGDGPVRLVSSDSVRLVQLPAGRNKTPASPASVGTSAAPRAPSARKPAAPSPAPTDAGDAAADATAGGGAGATSKPAIPPVPADVAAKGAELTALVADADAKRTQADTLLQSALDHYKAAADAADKYCKQVAQLKAKNTNRELPEQQIWDSILEAYNPSRFSLQSASVNLMIARLHQSAAEEIALRSKMMTLLQGALKEAAMTAPGDLSAAPLDLNAKANDERDKAAKAYLNADTLITNIEQASAVSTMAQQAQQLTRYLKIASYYGQAQLKGQTDPTGVKALVDQAVSEANGASSGGTDLAGGGASASGAGTAMALPLVIQDALNLRKSGGGDLSGVSTTTSGPSTEPTSGPTTGPAGPGSKVFEGTGESGTAETKPAATTKPDDAAAPAEEKPAAPEEKPAAPEEKPAATPEEKPAATGASDSGSGDNSTPAEKPEK